MFTENVRLSIVSFLHEKLIEFFRALFTKFMLLSGNLDKRANRKIKFEDVKVSIPK